MPARTRLSSVAGARDPNRAISPLAIGIRAEQGADHFGPAGPNEAGKPHHLAGENFDGDVRQFGRVHIPGEQDRLAGRARRPCELRSRWSPDHRADHLGVAFLIAQHAGHDGAVAQDGDAIAEHLHLLHAMGDVDDGDALFRQSRDGLKQAI
jgi:hypothetical protein